MSNPAVRRMSWRLGLTGFIAGFAFGALSPDEGEQLSQNAGVGLAVLIVLSMGIMLYESFRFYRHADELVRHVLMSSLAIGFCIVLTCMALYAAAQYLFDVPQISALQTLLFSWIVASVTWFYAAWKSM